MIDAHDFYIPIKTGDVSSANAMWFESNGALTPADIKLAKSYISRGISLIAYALMPTMEEDPKFFFYAGDGKV